MNKTCVSYQLSVVGLLYR